MALSSSKWHWHNRVKMDRLVYVDIQILQLLKGGIDQWGVGHVALFFGLSCIEGNKSLSFTSLRK
jgi:hypothetical protein